MARDPMRDPGVASVQGQDCPNRPPAGTDAVVV